MNVSKTQARLVFLKLSLLAGLAVELPPTFSKARADSGDRAVQFLKAPDPKKTYQDIGTENPIRRRRVTITRKTHEVDGPSFKKDSIEFDQARKYKIDQKTTELIAQLEDLSKRPGQQSRSGELKMRLAELYFERGQGVAAEESAAWDSQVQAWDKLSEAERATHERPVLKTPKADQLRSRSVKLYRELESKSRGADHGASQMIRRDVVLYFLASTLMDLNLRKEALPFYQELSDRFPQSAHLFSARVNFADLLFESNNFGKAIPLYLLVASGQGATPDDSVDTVKAYALYKLGWCYMNTNAHDKAVMAFQRALEVTRAAKGDRRIVLEREALSDLARAFALASQFDQGEKFFAEQGENGKEALHRFRSEAARMARDNGKLDIAAKFYTLLIEEDPGSQSAREFALEKVQISSKNLDIKVYQETLATFAKDYGKKSDWLSKQSEDKKEAVEDLVALLRREAKNYHRIAQVKDRTENFQQARGFYEVYFKFVPNPNAETPEHLHEMNFYFGELLFKLNDYAAAAEAYKKAGAGQYSATAAFARILSLKKAALANNDLVKDLTAAIDGFVAQYPDDKRSGELLYSSAQESFKTGSNEESIATLTKVVDRFSGSHEGVEAAERILFIYEKKNDIDGGIRAGEGFLANSKLVSAGGDQFSGRLKSYVDRSSFKKIEAMSSSNDIDAGAKAQAYLNFAMSSKGELKEKSLNNALVFAKQAKNAELARTASDALVKEFPNSSFATGVYAESAQDAAGEGRWAEAIRAYEAFIKGYKGPRSGLEPVLWNRLFLKAQLEDAFFQELIPSKDVSQDVVELAQGYLKEFPSSKNRAGLLEMLSLRKGATAKDVVALRRLPALSSEEKQLFAESEIVLQVRASQNLAKVAQSRLPANATGLLKHAVAVANFRLIQPRFESYSKQKLNYKMNSFAKSLKEKISGLEKLEKSYLAVVGLGDGEVALESLERLSSLYRTLADDIDKAPAPKEELKAFSKPLFDKGVGFLKTCLEKASEYKIGGAGLAACRTASSAVNADFAGLTDEAIPDAMWLPANREGLRPVLVVATEALRKGNLGEVVLATKLVAEGKTPASAFELSTIEVLLGLVAHRHASIDDAVRHFRKATESDNPSLRAAAFKNLAVTYVHVSDFAQAVDAAKALKLGDAESALLLGLSHAGLSEFKDAVAAYDAGLEKSPNHPALLLDRALALAALAQYGEAAKSVQRYIEVATPPESHFSRALFRKWKDKPHG